MKRLLPLAYKMLPKILQTCAIAFTLNTLYLNQNKIFQKYQCAIYTNQTEIDPLNKILPQVVKVTLDGNTLGYAFCFQENILVTASPALMLKEKKFEKFQFLQSQHKIASQYKIEGHFQNLTFIRLINPQKTISPMPFIQQAQKVSITPVQIILKKTFLLIKNGYLVNKDAGFGIITGSGQVGSLVLSNGKAVGVVSHIGRDQQFGFLRIVNWKGIINVFKKLSEQPKKLGISTSSFEIRDGLSVSRISLNSPLKDKLLLGDIIVKVNHQTIRNADDLTRIIMVSDENLKFKVQRQGKFVLIDLVL